eukprot:TsM_001103600 transcript=TsM_001103600 gene=TsM_001103600
MVFWCFESSSRVNLVMKIWNSGSPVRSIRLSLTSLCSDCEHRKSTMALLHSNPKGRLDCETRIQTESRLSQAEPDLFDASQKRIEAL